MVDRAQQDSRSTIREVETKQINAQEYQEYVDEHPDKNGLNSQLTGPSMDTFDRDFVPSNPPQLT